MPMPLLARIYAQLDGPLFFLRAPLSLRLRRRVINNFLAAVFNDARGVVPLRPVFLPPTTEIIALGKLAHGFARYGKCVYAFFCCGDDGILLFGIADCA